MCSLLLDETLLESHEVRWLDEYHADCRSLLLPHLLAMLDTGIADDGADTSESALRWLMRESEPVSISMQAGIGVVIDPWASSTLAQRRARWAARGENGVWLYALQELVNYPSRN